MDTSELRPVTVAPDKGVQYFAYACSKCGAEARNTYSEPHRTRMLERRLCWHCNYWCDFEENHPPEKHRGMTIIDGAVYSPGNRTEGQFRGMSGRRFDLEYIEPSTHAGKRITTFDLWYGSVIPEELRQKYPDTAKFLNGAERAQVGETTCWNHSDWRPDPYPLPRSIGIE